MDDTTCTRASRITGGASRCLLALVVAALAASAAGQQAAEAHRKGSFSLSFGESDPNGDYREMKRRKVRGADPANEPKDKVYDIAKLTYRAVVPESYDPAKPAPLFVWISATDNGGMPGEFGASLASRGIIFVGADGTGNDWWPPYRYRAAVDAVHNMKKLYNIDSAHVFIAGNSGGGRCASEVALAYSDVFTGGGFYVIGCNFWENIPHEKGGIIPGFGKCNPRQFSLAKSHYYVFMTGSKDFNRHGTVKTYEGYKKSGFANCFYNETSELGHSIPPAADVEKAFAFLDRSLQADVIAACAEAERLVHSHRYAEAVKKLAPLRGRGTADALWEQVVAAADDETDKVLAAKGLKPGPRREKLSAITKKYAGAAKKAAAEIKAIESSPEFAAEKTASEQYRRIERDFKANGRARTIRDLEALAAKYSGTEAAARARGAAAELKRAK